MSVFTGFAVAHVMTVKPRQPRRWNILIGGGGGIALMAGMSRLFPLPVYLLTVICAVAPVPLFMVLAEQL